MATKRVDIHWSPKAGYFDHLLQLNSIVDGGYAFHAKTVDLLGGPEQEILVGETDFSVPYDIRAKLQPRAFGIVVTINEAEARYDSLWHRRRHELLKAAYSGVIRVGVERTMSTDTGAVTRYMYLECRCEQVKELEPGTFELSLLAADPMFTEYYPLSNDDPDNVERQQEEAEAAWQPGDPDPKDWMVAFQEESVNTGNPAAGADGYYVETQQTPYVGSAPTEPTLTFEVMGDGRVWRYRKDFSIKNPSTITYTNYMVCVDLAEVLGSGDPLFNKVNADLGDIRIETFGGARKPIYLRRHDNAGGQGSGDYLKIWFMINSLAPGETKYFRLLYGNTYATLEPENSSVKMMFNGFSSTNDLWRYSNFLPRYDQPQSRAGQWVPHLQGRENITWLAYPHPDFTTTDTTLVNAAMGKAVYHGRAAGYAGVQFSNGLSITQVEYPVKTRTNFKAPFVQRSQRPDGRWVDDYTNGTSTGNRAHPKVSVGAGVTTIDLAVAWGSAYQWFVGDTVKYAYSDGTSSTGTISTVAQSPVVLDPVGPTYCTRITVSGAPSQTVQIWDWIYQNPTGKVVEAGRTQTFPSGDEPRTVMLGIRSDSVLDITDYTYAGSEECYVTFKSAELPEIRWRQTADVYPTFTGTTFVSGHEYDMNTAANGYQLTGRFENRNDGKGIRINTIMESGVRDRLVIDCKARTCLYYKWQSSLNSYADPENRYEALYFEEVRDYWLRMVPEQSSGALVFVHDNNSNFRNLRSTIRWANRFY